MRENIRDFLTTLQLSNFLSGEPKVIKIS